MRNIKRIERLEKTIHQDAVRVIYLLGIAKADEKFDRYIATYRSKSYVATCCDKDQAMERIGKWVETLDTGGAVALVSIRACTA